MTIAIDWDVKQQLIKRTKLFSYTNQYRGLAVEVCLGQNAVVPFVLDRYCNLLDYDTLAVKIRLNLISAKP